MSMLAFTPIAKAVVYSTILDINQSVTGVRGLDSSSVVLTGSYQNSGATLGLVYAGPIAGGGTSYFLNPTFGGQTVTTSIFYSADTPLFNPSIGAGNVRVVGSYQYSESATLNHGLVYEGPLAGGGTWSQINVPSVAVGGAIIENTIPHSTMGNLVVGDYDLQGVPASGNAFIYNLSNDSYVLFELNGSTSNLTTAYGIWQNGVGSASYTIAGGTMHLGVNKAFLVNYDTGTGLFTNLTYYNDPDATGLSHFEGITGVPGGYNLIATTDAGAAFASVLSDGSTYGSATWTAIDYPGSDLTTGDSVYQNIAMGIYIPSGGGSVRSYIATVPEPREWAIAIAGLMGVLIVLRRRNAPRAAAQIA
jgi:hypothetical protein